MSVTKDAIRKETKKKVAIETKRVERKHQLKESSQKLEELSMKWENTKRELEEKEEELSFLQMQEQHQSNNEVLRCIIADQEAEISHLVQKVTRVEREVTQARDAQLSMAAKRVEELREERDQIKKDLENKKTVLYFLRLQLQEQSQKNSVKLRATIERKEAEIDLLRGHMIDIERDLIIAQEEHEELRQHLRQTTVELVEQSEQVRTLERTRADLERERSRVDTKLKIEIAKSEVSCVGLLFLYLVDVVS